MNINDNAKHEEPEIDSEQAFFDEADKLVAEVVRGWKKKIPDLLQEKQELRTDFEKALYVRWKLALDLLEVIYFAVQNAGEEFRQKHTKRIDKDDLRTFKVLFRLHARACLVTSEILTLLKSGHADGAMARWRTLQEINVVANFIAKHGEDAAFRYMQHEAIEDYKAAEQFNRYYTPLMGVAPIDSSELARLKQGYDNLCNLYGQGFKSDYGWAANALRAGNPRFEPSLLDLEKDISADSMRPYFKMASNAIHGGPKGVMSQLGTIGTNRFMLAGPSNAGLADPGIRTLSSFLLCTSALFELAPDINAAVSLKALVSLSQEAEAAFLAAHQITVEKWSSSEEEFDTL